MQPDNFASGVTALVLIAIIIAGLAITTFRAIKAEAAEDEESPN